MSYYTTITVISKEGRGVKARVSCGSENGYTDESGKITFSMSQNDMYRVYAEYYNSRASGEVRGGGELVLRLN
ncbi:MAG: hypothetical protein LBU69_05405 [Deltaproteobacteria bacterium]|jgi:hypothetical protein|nr:hypothetical protein [Deltaproteobacteria bacterium]